MFKIFSELRESFLQKNSDISQKKISLMLLFVNVITSASVSIYIPCMKQIATDLDTTNAMMQMTIVAHLVGEFVGRIFCGPMMLSFKKKHIIKPAISIAILGQLGCFFSINIWMFVAMRLVQAVGASVIYITSVAIINETFEEKGSILGLLELYQPIAWIVSPFVGCIFAELGQWRLIFLMLAAFQFIGKVFFWICLHKEKPLINKSQFSFSSFINNYRLVLKNTTFLIYSTIPGLFAGGYMIYASNTPFICAKFLGNTAADIAILQAVPLIFYILSTFGYRYIVRNIGVSTSKRIGTSFYILFGVFIGYTVFAKEPWTGYTLLLLMCLQCTGSAFLVPVSVLKALQLSANASSVGASTVVVFRNIIMSLCISATAWMRDDITMIIGAVFMTVGTALLLITTRRVIKTIANRRNSFKQ